MSLLRDVFTQALRRSPLSGFLLALILFMLAQMVVGGLVAPLVGWLLGLDRGLLPEIVSGQFEVHPSARLVFQVLQFFNQLLVWGLPAVLLASWLGKPGEVLQLRLPKPVWVPLLAGLVMLVALPLVQWTFLPANSIQLPSFLQPLEQAMLDQESQVQRALMGMFTQGGAAALPFHLLVFAIMPGLCEELFFRGFLLAHTRRHWNVHLAVWAVALLFSLMHFQVLGLFSRLLLGGLLGYFVVYGGSIWPAVIAHAIFNGVAVAATVLAAGSLEESAPLPEEARPVWYLALASGLLTAFLMNRYRDAVEPAEPTSVSS